MGTEFSEHAVATRPRVQVADLLDAADDSARRVVENAASIAGARLRTEREIVAAADRLRPFCRPVADPFRSIDALRPVAGITSADLFIAVLLEVARLEWQLAPDLDSAERERLLELARAVDIAREEPVAVVARPFSYRFATRLASESGTSLCLAQLVSALPFDRRFELAVTRRYSDGEMTRAEVVAVVDAFVSERASGPLLGEDVAVLPVGDASEPLAWWAARWLDWESKLGTSIDLSTYLAAGAASLDGESVLDVPVAETTLRALLRVEPASFRLSHEPGRVAEPRLLSASIIEPGYRDLLRRIRLAKRPLSDKMLHAARLVGEPLLRELVALDARFDDRPA